MKTLLTLILLVVGGCSSMKASMDRVTFNLADPNIVTYEHYEASHETLLVDWERYGFSGHINGFGSVGSNRSRVESEAG